VKKRFLLSCIVIALAFGMNVQAAAYDIQKSETDTEKVYTLTFEETKKGKINEKDIPEIYDYDGKEYHLVSADIEYSYVKKEDSIAIGKVTEKYLIKPDEVKNIPKYVTVGNILYVLDEESVSIKPIETKELEGADVVTMTESADNLPDNDLKRIPFSVEKGGVSYKLLYVTYDVTDKDEYGIPIEYSAACHYAGLNTYKVFSDTAWEVVAGYTGYRSKEYVKSSEISYVYEFREEIEPEFPEEKPEEPVLIISNEPKTNILPIAVGAAGGVFFVILAGLFFLTVPVYAVLGTGEYKFIGRMRLRRRKNQYEGTFREGLSEKGEFGNFMVKIPERIRKRSGIGMLEIKCPDGRTIRKRMQEQILFSVH